MKADFVQDDERIRQYFKDWDAVTNDPNRVACKPPPRDPEDDIIQSPSAPPKQKGNAPTNLWGGESSSGTAPAPAPAPTPPPPPDPGSGSDPVDAGSGSASGSATPAPPAKPAPPP